MPNRRIYFSMFFILTLMITFPAFSAEIAGWVKGDTCWATKEPSMDATVVGILKRKAAITVEDVGSGWLRIVFAPVRNPATGKFIDCAGCFIQKKNFTTVLGQW